MCIYRLQSPSTRRTYSPCALATRSPSSQRCAAYSHPVTKTHPPPCQAIKPKQNQNGSRPRSSHPSIGVCVNRNQSQIRIEFDPAREAATQASACVSTVIKVKSESNSVPPADQQHAHHYHGVIRVPCAVRDSDLYSKDVGCR